MTSGRYAKEYTTVRVEEGFIMSLSLVKQVQRGYETLI